jgi:hypothetical protein
MPKAKEQQLKQMLRQTLRQDLAVETSLLALDDRLGLGLTAYQAAILEDWFLTLERERSK